MVNIVKFFPLTKTLCVKTCKIFYQKNKCKTFYKNLTASHPTLSPFLILYLSSLTLAQTSDNTHRHASLRVHFASTYLLLSTSILVATTIRSQPILLSEKSLCEDRGEPYYRRSIAHCSNLASNLEMLLLRSLIWNH